MEHFSLGLYSFKIRHFYPNLWVIPSRHGTTERPILNFLCSSTVDGRQDLSNHNVSSNCPSDGDSFIPSQEKIKEEREDFMHVTAIERREIHRQQERRAELERILSSSEIIGM